MFMKIKEDIMNLNFNEEQIMLRDMVRQFAETEIAPFVEQMEQGEFPREILKKWGVRFNGDNCTK